MAETEPDTHVMGTPGSGEPDTAVGTAAEGPHALGALATGSRASQSSMGGGASAGGVSGAGALGVSAHGGTHGTQQPSTDTHPMGDREMPRVHLFHLFAVIAPTVMVALSFVLGGDPKARLGMAGGFGVVAFANLGLLYLTSAPARYRPRVAEALWLTAVVGAQPALLYFGPMSAIVMLDLVGILFVAFGQNRWTALVTVTICVAAHTALTVPILVGEFPDRGLLSTLGGAHEYQRLITEGMILALLAAGYPIGRWARRTNAAALSELQLAMRALGDREQALAEVKDDAARAKRVDSGRWTGETLGSYRLGLVLGRGAMGEVYEAEGPGGQRAAIKLLNARSTTSASLVERFHREMAVAAKLDSPHIVKVYALSPPTASVPYIAMERLHGIDLATRLRGETRVTMDEVVVLIDQVARGLEISRKAGIVHRDLKPQNLFRHEGTTWKILDFGVAKVVDSEGTLTGEGIVGTPQYMAPEQASGGEVSPIADVYALAAITYRCITGRALFKGKDLPELIYQVVHAPPVRPTTLSKISPAVEDVLAIALAKDPTKRFPSALAFVQAFVAARRGRPIQMDVPENAWK